MMLRLLTIGALALGGCVAEQDPAAPAPDVHIDDVGDGIGVVPDDRTHGRDRRRMDIDQLAASMQRVSGGLRWTDGPGTDGPDLFTELSNTLGKPDYADRTQEDLDPGLLFQKFLDDASTSVCTKMVAAEVRGSSDKRLMLHAAPTDTWETNPDGIRKNMQTQILRFHGRSLDAQSKELEPWIWLFRTTSDVNGSPSDAWRTVCVGLFTHPDFYTY